MKRLSLILVLAGLLIMAASAAYANFAIHGGYLADTDACAGCHRAHTATSMIEWLDNANYPHNSLLVGPPTDQVYIFCYVCHSNGAPGAATDVETGILDTTLSPGGDLDSSSTANAPLNGGGFSEYFYYKTSNSEPVTSFHLYTGAAWPVWGSGEKEAYELKMDCISCHDPHGSSNYRILKDYVNGHDVGGFFNTVPGDPDPIPYPWVISAEKGYPYAGDEDPNLHTPNPTDGFRKHRQYTTYTPSYTWARYAKGTNGLGSVDERHGMSGWCTACHENYMAKVSVAINSKPTATVAEGDGAVTSPNSGDDDWDADRKNDLVVAILQGSLSAGDTTVVVDDASGFADAPGFIQVETEVMRYTAIIRDNNPSTPDTFIVMRGQQQTPAVTHISGERVYQAYDAGDGLGSIARHRHPVNVSLSAFNGPVALTYDPFAFQASYPGGTEFVDLPLDHAKAERGVNQAYELTDWIECLTCHRAHGTSVRMERYANAGLSPQAFPGGWGQWSVPDPVGRANQGVPPADQDADGAMTDTHGSQLLRADNRGVCERCHNK